MSRGEALYAEEKRRAKSEDEDAERLNFVIRRQFTFREVSHDELVEGRKSRDIPNPRLKDILSHE